MDKLKNIYDEIAAWCQQNNVGICHGVVKEGAFRHEIEWNNPLKENDYLGFISLLKSTDVRIIIVELMLNKIVLENSDIKEYEKELEIEAREGFRKSLKKVREHHMNVLSLQIGLIERGVHYKYLQVADWAEDFLAVENLIHKLYPKEELINEKAQSEHKFLEREIVEEIAREIVTQDSYRAAKGVQERRALSDKHCATKEISNFWDLSQIGTMAESIYQLEIKPVLEEALKTKILALKAKDYSKVKIIGELGITKSVLDKFYYSSS